ncbi:MAG TPA: DUF1549 and DUF1553 domain-containing protein, partial [Chthoniobacteraceae bacterium]|nr:DUF1549 and DUF1553 domain-containing protein [Chthoniobacteraceae bacterium]
LRGWIDQGAKWPEDAGSATGPFAWWSLRPLARPPVPKNVGAHSDGVTHPHSIDAFVRTRLAREKLAPSPEADRRTLIRRIFFDLIGLPPTRKELATSMEDRAPDWFEKLVDRLLASPRYGERWARHWLDVVHYGDTHGYDKDQPRPNAWPYRDYVIRALNNDKPFARFAQEQIAGDILYPSTADGIVALGFLAAGPWDLIGHAELPESKLDGKIARILDRDDMVATTMNTFCALTVQCARCHNHKFDPVSQVDYYRLQAVFAALDRTDRRFDPDPKTGARRAELVAQRNALREASALWKRRSDRVPQWITDAEISAALQATTAELSALPPEAVVYAGTVHYGSGNFAGTHGTPRPIFVLARGDPRKPSRAVEPGTVRLNDNASGLLGVSSDAPEGERRAALARWITAPDNPLTWRVIVNRVWQYHFGRGLVDSPNDFGRMGQQPSHPELLDWLACEFRDGGQSLKALHRLIVTSATYRQSSTALADAMTRDVNNVFLSHMNRRKLDAEALRDAILMIAGALDFTMGGPGFRDFTIEKPEHSPHYNYAAADPADRRTHRRSIYRFLVRSQPQPLMSALDCADPSISVDKRNESASALQALALSNDPLVITMAQRFARRIEEANVAGRTSDARNVALAFREALEREATAEELEALVPFTEAHGLSNLCRLLMNLNEFAFVD